MSKVVEALRPSDYSDPNISYFNSERVGGSKRVNFKSINSLIPERLIQTSFTDSGEIAELRIVGHDTRGRPICKEIIDNDQILWNIVKEEIDTLRSKNPNKDLFLLKGGLRVTRSHKGSGKYRDGNLTAHTLVRISDVSRNDLVIICSVIDGKRIDNAEITFTSNGQKHTLSLPRDSFINNTPLKKRLNGFKNKGQFIEGIK
jgi:hypothetical protein